MILFVCMCVCLLQLIKTLITSTIIIDNHFKIIQWMDFSFVGNLKKNNPNKNHFYIKQKQKIFFGIHIQSEWIIIHFFFFFLLFIYSTIFFSPTFSWQFVAAIKEYSCYISLWIVWFIYPSFFFFFVLKKKKHHF